MATGQQRFVQQQVARAAGGVPELPTAVVTSTSPFTVSFRGASLQIRRLAAYTPSNGDVVTLVRSGGTWVALGPTV